MFSITFLSLAPELFLSLSILIFLIVNTVVVNSMKYNFPVLKNEIFSQVILILFFSIFILNSVQIGGYIASNLFFIDASNINIKLIWLFFCLGSFVLIWRSSLIQKLNFFEFFLLYLLSIFASLLLLSSSDLLAVYLIIELQSICFYTLASFRRGFSFSSEAGLKYFISSAFMSCIFLLGASILYGSLGTLNLPALSLLLSFPLVDSASYTSSLVLVGSLFIIIFLLFKLSVVPFHFWFPQIYDGSPLAATIIFSILPKFVVFSILVKWLLVVNGVSVFFSPFILACGVVSSLVGVFLALRQKKIKKLFIYSSIGQLGLPICALALDTFNSVLYSYFFFIVYLITSILLWGYYLVFFSSSSLLSKNKESVLFISSLTNLFYFNKIWALSILIIFFSMCGVPPLAGFISKFWIFFSLIDSNYFLVSVFLILLTGFSAFYYVKVLKVSFFENKAPTVSGENQSIFKNDFFSFDCTIFAFCLFLLIFLTFYPDLIFYYLNIIVSSLV